VLLCKEAAAYKHSALASSTKCTYRSQLNAFLRFCLYFGCVPAPADQTTLKCYVAFLARSLNPSSIPGYLNVVRLLHLNAGLPNPLVDNWELNMIKRGVTRVLGRPPLQKLPITLKILREMYQLIDLTVPGDLVFWTACLVCFFGLLRKSSLLQKTSNDHSQNYLLRSDIVDLCLSSFLLKVRHSKTIQFGQRLLTIPFVSCPDERICPVSMLIRLLGKNPLPGSVALFSYSAGNKVISLTHSTFVLKLRALLGRLGYRSTDFSGHSFRRGVALSVLKLGLIFRKLNSGVIGNHSLMKSICISRLG
jgi:hypothetical protein